MKTAVRRIVSVGILLILLFAMQRLVMPKYVDDVIEGGFTAEYYREENPHEVLMIGDCELYENFSPVTMWKNYGITSYIRGSAQQLTWQSYYLLEDALKYETPDVVVFNVLELKYNEPQREEYNRMTLDGMRWSASKVQAIRASMLPEEHFIDYVFPLLRYHSRVTELTANDWKYYFKDKTRTTAGYYMRVDTAPYEEGIWEEDEPESDTLGKNAMAYLEKIRMLCEKNHIRLLLVKAPSKSPVWYDTWESQILEYATRYDLDYINFLNLVDEIGIDYNTDTYDQGLHMNLSGAEKCADYLGKFLSETYGLKDLRSDKTICSDWKNKTIFYENMKKAQYTELKKYGEIVNYKKIISLVLAIAMVLLVPVSVVSAAPKGYGFRYAGVTVYVHGKAEKLIDKMGEPNKKSKSKSCAYDGEDIKYVYDDFTLVTYTEKKGGTEYVQSIKFTSKKAKTKEGIKIGSKEKTMKKKYGRARDNFGVYTYKKGKMGITFTVDDGKVSAIQYVAY